MRVYILRGVSGSGKSTFATTFPKNSVIHSTDSYFYKAGKYRFDLKKLQYKLCKDKIEADTIIQRRV